MSNFIKGSLGAALFLVVFSLAAGSTAWVAIDILNIKIKYLSGGEPGQLSINYWNAIFGSGFLLITISTIKIFISSVAKLGNDRNLEKWEEDDDDW